jgi:hypothetical protein
MGLAPLRSGLSPDACVIACSPKGLTERYFRVRMSLNFNNRTFLLTVCGQVIRQLC